MDNTRHGNWLGEKWLEGVLIAPSKESGVIGNQLSTI